MSKVMHQISAKAERAFVARGEALRDPASDETQGTTHGTEGTGSGLLLEALTRQNLLRAFGGDIPAKSCQAGSDSKTGRRRARAWHSHGGGSADSKSATLSASAINRFHIKREQPRLSARTHSARCGTCRAVVSAIGQESGDRCWP